MIWINWSCVWSVPSTWNPPFLWKFLAPPLEPGIRVSHILMKWEALTSHDPTARRAAPKGRLQSELGPRIFRNRRIHQPLEVNVLDILLTLRIMFWTLHKRGDVFSVFRWILFGSPVYTPVLRSLRAGVFLSQTRSLFSFLLLRKIMTLDINVGVWIEFDVFALDQQWIKDVSTWANTLCDFCNGV